MRTWQVRVDTPVPGRRSLEMLRRQEQRESNARTYPRHLPVALRRGHGSYLEDVDGNVYLDFLAGAGVMALGHSHPAVEEAVREQLGMLAHGLDFPTPAKEAFTAAQLRMLPDHLRHDFKIHFCGPTGANAVEAAIKLCRAATGRTQLVSFAGAFHGSTQGASAVSGNLEPKQLQGGATHQVQFAPYPYCARCPLKLDPASCSTACAAVLENMLEDTSSGVPAPAAVIMELVQGEGGAIPAPVEFVRRVRAVTSRLGIPLIVDEVQTGGGRTGKWFAFERYGIKPDVVVASKALGGGLPVAVLLYDRRLDVWGAGAHIGTFRGNQLAFAAGAALVAEVEREDLLAHVARCEDQVRRGLAGLRRLPHVFDVRGVGLMWGIELRECWGVPAQQLAREVQGAALRRGLVLEVGGRDDTVLRLLPPLNISRDELDTGLTILARALEGVCSRETPRADAVPVS